MRSMQEVELVHGVSVCKLLEPIAARCGFHVALTGGTLYKQGARKDIDVILYTHNGGELDERQLGIFLSKLHEVRIRVNSQWSRVIKLVWKRDPLTVISIDLIIPQIDGDYPE